MSVLRRWERHGFVVACAWLVAGNIHPSADTLTPALTTNAAGRLRFPRLNTPVVLPEAILLLPRVRRDASVVHGLARNRPGGGLSRVVGKCFEIDNLLVLLVLVLL